VNFYNRIPADYLERIDTSVLYAYGVNEGGGIGILALRNPIGITISSIEHEEQYIRLSYWLSGKRLDYKIPLVTTACTYGGKRFWFSCIYCRRRVGVLYRRGECFACRHCNYLTYESRNLSGREKGMGRIVSDPELKIIESKVRRKTYGGMLTRKYRRYLRAIQKARFAYLSRFQMFAT
jgi:hypothetical protein